MLQIRRILCPVDLSECSQHALDHAAAIGHWYQSALTVLHVFDTAVAAYPPVPGWAGPIPAVIDREKVLADVARAASAADDGGISAVVMTRDGDAVGKSWRRRKSCPPTCS